MQDQLHKTMLDDHRNMLMVSKQVSEFQEKNLKTWPLIVFQEGLDKVEVSYNFIDKEELFYAGEVTFNFTFKGDYLPSDKIKIQALKTLMQWTKVLLYTDTKVNFKLKGKEWK